MDGFFDKFRFVGKIESGAVDNGKFNKALFETDESEGKFTVNLNVKAKTKRGENKQTAKITGKKKNKIKFNMMVGEEKKEMEVAWKDREQYVDKATKTYTYKVGDEEKKFLTTYDLAKHVQEKWDDIKDKKLYVGGSILFIYVEKRMTPTYRIENVYEVDEDADEKLELEVNMVLDKFSTKISTSALLKMPNPSDRQVCVNSMVRTLVIKKGGFENKYSPFQFKIDFSTVDLEDKGVQELVDLINDLYTLDYTNPMSPKKMTTGKYYKTTVVGNIINSKKEDEEVDLTKLPKQIQRLIELGAISLEDAKKQLSIRGEYVRDIYLTFPKVDSTPVLFAVDPKEVLDLNEETVDEESIEETIKKQVAEKKKLNKPDESEPDEEPEEEPEEEEEESNEERIKKMMARLSGN